GGADHGRHVADSDTAGLGEIRFRLPSRGAPFQVLHQLTVGVPIDVALILVAHLAPRRLVSAAWCSIRAWPARPQRAIANPASPPIDICPGPDQRIRWNRRAPLAAACPSLRPSRSQMGAAAMTEGGRRRHPSPEHARRLGARPIPSGEY